MIRKLFIVLLVFLTSTFTWSQGNYEWVIKSTFEIDSTGSWSSDVMGNTYTTKKELINKYDTAGILQFSQSHKSFGRISSLHPINTMKMVVFSEEQQVICLLDNTLTQSEKCIELVDQNIGNASRMAISGQPDKMWVYDQLNSSLYLLSFSKKEQQQSIENLRGILNINNLTRIIEQNNSLYLVDAEKGVFVLDLYGTLIDKIPVKQVKSLHVEGRIAYLLVEDGIHMINLDTRKENHLKLPIQGVKDFRKSGDFIYLQTKNKLIKYRFLFSD